MKIAVAIAPSDAPDSAFVVYRGIKESMKKAQMLGYDGVELALASKNQVDRIELKKLLSQYNLSIPTISTGQVFAIDGYSFTHPQKEIREKTKEIFYGLIELASEFGAMINIGRVRGPIYQGETLETTKSKFFDTIQSLLERCEKYGVTLVLEPVNRYEINFINSVAEGSELVRQIGNPKFKLMPDLFHMNIEDTSIEAELVKNMDIVGYIHFADSNRMAPGWGHLNYSNIIKTIKATGYGGWISVEILPKPDSDSASRQSIAYLRNLI